ncbi:hypothetical protein SESBI_21835 [Sesbania bispinosa]|nr:hypothetical protein SESBI_21835 [Sesbania bispinosa]
MAYQNVGPWWRTAHDSGEQHMGSSSSNDWGEQEEVKSVAWENGGSDVLHSKGRICEERGATHGGAGEGWRRGGSRLWEKVLTHGGAVVIEAGRGRLIKGFEATLKLGDVRGDSRN